MRRRVVLAAALEVALFALVAGMFAFSIHMVRQELVWRQQGMAVGPAARVAVDVSMWWLEYWWMVAPLLVLGAVGLGAVIVFTSWPAALGPAQSESPARQG